jgi:uncharacterized protein (TIGR03435 family)
MRISQVKNHGMADTLHFAKGMFSVAFCVAALASPVAIRIAHAGPQQSQPATSAPLTFDVASIKEWPRGEHPLGPYAAGVQISTGRVFSECADLRSLLAFAYHLTWSSPLEGLPPWASAPCGGSDLPNDFRIQATMPPETTEDQAREMMQSLLADRFKLTIHREKRNMPVYALVVTPSGFKLKPYVPADDKPAGPGAYACPAADRSCRAVIGTDSMSDLAGSLGSVVGRPVIDATGVDGEYKIFFQWAGDNSIDSPLPSLSTALREDLGLELKSQTAPVDVLVVDHVEKPTPN